MRVRIISAAVGLTLVVAVAASGQNPGSSGATARLGWDPVQLIMPERFHVPLILRASRQVWVAAPADGVLSSVAEIGKTVKGKDDVAQLDRAGAEARLKIAEAQVKEMQAELDQAKEKSGGSKSAVAVAEARLDAAKARAELAQLDVKQCTLKAPFAGRVLSSPFSAGAYVAKGAAVAEVADVSTLGVMVPVERNSVKAGDAMELTTFDNKTVKGKVLAVLPLDERFAVLRELVSSWAQAWVSVPNNSGELEPGQRVKNPSLPAEPITTVAKRALDRTGNGKVVQVLRMGYAYDVPVQVLGPIGSERVQVAGAFQPYDAVITESSQAIAAGTAVNFNDAAGPTFTPPVGGAPAAASTAAGPARSNPYGGGAYGGNSRVAGIGAPDSNAPAGGNAPRTNPAPRPAAKRAAPQPAAPQPAAKPARGGGVVPF